MGNYKNEIEKFIYDICYRPMWEAAYTYIFQHPYSLDLTYSRIKYPDSAMLEDMVLEFTKNIRIDEDSLLFDAIVSCTVNLTEDNYCGLASHEVSQWLIISCVAVVTDKLQSLSITEIKTYSPNQQRKTDGQAASKNIVPILYKKDLDAEATAFLTKYYPAALEKPMPIPIVDIAEGMGLEVLQGHRITDDFTIFGEICFSEGKVNVYDLFKCNSYEVPVRRGTILIDAYTFWERNLGCVNNTIAHEVYHWYRHRMYAAIKHILRNEKFIACRCPADLVYPTKKEDWTDEQRMEWQANNLAPRILMPVETFRTKVDELYKQYNYKDSPIKLTVLTCIADDLTRFYGVSRQSALIRMIETGYKEAAGVYQYGNDAEHHSYLDRVDAFYEYSTNSEFRKLIDSGLFKYVDGYFVINDEKYIELDDIGGLTLTDYAWANLSKCTLQFTWQVVKYTSSHKHLPFEIFHRANADQKTSKYDNKQNASVIQLSEELQKKREEFERQNSMHKLTSINKSCWQMIFEIIKARGLSKSHFCNLTGLDEVVYRRAEKNMDSRPSLRTIVSISCGLDLDLNTTEKILQLAGRTFDESDEHQALKFCITGFTGSPIEERNSFLESYGYEPLGTKQRA